MQVTKRDEESSLMQLKEEFRSYEALRREHDSQIIQIAMESGLRIAPDQWSSLLYGDTNHKSHMQSIIDKVKHSYKTPLKIRQDIKNNVIQYSCVRREIYVTVQEDAVRENFKNLTSFSGQKKNLQTSSFEKSKTSTFTPSA
jgi:hypothetical protein